MPNDQDIPYEASIEHFELYHIYNDTSSDDTACRYRPDSEDWKAAVLKGPALPALGQGIAGAAGAAVSTISTYPLSLIVTRLQLQRQLRAVKERDRERKRRSEKGKGKTKSEGVDIDDDGDGDGDEEEYKGIIDAAKKIYENEGGLRELYAGLTQATGKAVMDSFVFFLTYSFLRQRRLRARGLKMHGSFLPVVDELAVGYLAESFTKLLTMPVSTVLTRKQVEGLVSASSSTEPGKKTAKTHTSSTSDIVSAIITEKGLRGLWAGYCASLILSLNPSLTFLLNQFFKLSLLPRDKRRRPPASATFLFAAISKAIASSLTYPFSMAKTRAQAATATATSAPTTRPPPTILHAIYSIARTEGFAALYAGLSGDVLRGFFSHGIAMLAKDTVYRLVVRAYYLLLRIVRRYPSPEELLARARARAEEVAVEMREGAGELAAKAGEKAGDVKGAVVKGMAGMSGIGSGRAAGIIGKVADGTAEVKSRVVEDVYEDSNATAEMVGEYVEDEAEEWRSLYRWFWDKGKL
ncbi:mitochondrial carrier protein [Blastomyces gilchristii SLH14081]|uniref:Mitochondrial carrier protein n=1 Tax=Blastomyces gilchristii (strain SLH14081) TaxID=559298 RepID=A0A179UPP2_BLAGS|nr:mitochondrial carrier protein [Blastomyces gilchristii SLH14081]OAT09974.1 mitochondrial carrier protein [Blastomyces gilchristii SLH14081]